MYVYIKGTITEIGSNYVIIDNNNIGYIIYVPNPYSYSLDDYTTIYTYTCIKEDEHSLYGFKNREEKDLFLKLISVKGVGPKMALPIIATGSMTGIADAVERENILYLKKFPKIGDKVAKQIILDLKGKITSTNTGLFKTEDTNVELMEVLQGLGYKQSDIKKVLPKVNYDLSLENQIKEALKLLLK